MSLNMPIYERLMRAISVNEVTGCWEWLQARTVTGGYGVVSIANRQQRVHRAMWRVKFGEIPDGMCVLHKCDNPPCCNPEHLFLGTIGDNNRDRDEKGRHAKGEACTRNRRSYKGSHNPRAKLSDEKAEYIRSRYAVGGIRLKDLAVEFGVSIHSVWMIVKGRRYQSAFGGK